MLSLLADSFIEGRIPREDTVFLCERFSRVFVRDSNCRLSLGEGGPLRELPLQGVCSWRLLRLRTQQAAVLVTSPLLLTTSHTFEYGRFPFRKSE